MPRMQQFSKAEQDLIDEAADAFVHLVHQVCAINRSDALVSTCVAQVIVAVNRHAGNVYAADAGWALAHALSVIVPDGGFSQALTALNLAAIEIKLERGNKS